MLSMWYRFRIVRLLIVVCNVFKLLYVHVFFHERFFFFVSDILDQTSELHYYNAMQIMHLVMALINLKEGRISFQIFLYLYIYMTGYYFHEKFFFFVTGTLDQTSEILLLQCDADYALSNVLYFWNRE